MRLILKTGACLVVCFVVDLFHCFCCSLHMRFFPLCDWHGSERNAFWFIFFSDPPVHEGRSQKAAFGRKYFEKQVNVLAP